MLRKIFIKKTLSLVKSSSFYFSFENHYQTDPKISQSLKASDFLEQRHIGPNETDINQMLSQLSLSSLDQLAEQVVPKDVYDPKAFLKDEIKFPNPLTESHYFTSMREISQQNQLKKTYIGCGYYNTITPAIILRSVIENPVWYTPYTPYQAEISQGRLECLLYYQTMIAELTGLPFSNCSLLDEGTAAAEAMFMSYNIASFKKNKFFVSKNVFPQTIDVVRTRAKPLGIEIIIEDPLKFDFEAKGDEICGALFQNPDNYGHVIDFTELTAKLKKNKITVILATDLLALTLCKTPGEMGVDITIGSAQRFGVPLGYGGPAAAFFATTDEHKRKIPGRIIGISQDKHKEKVYRMAMQTREQHIRREKATSNICTSQALLANVSALYGIYHGPQGLKKIGERVHNLTQILAFYADKMGFDVRDLNLNKNSNNCSYFDTLSFNTSNVDFALKEFLKENINIRKIDSNTFSISLDETTTLEDVAQLISIFARLNNKTIDKSTLFYENSYNLRNLSQNLLRKTPFMQQQIFNSIHSETQMLRFIRNISKKDISLAKSMIPLGSCTMKLNASSEMAALTWPHISNIHPFVPLDQAQGYQRIINELHDWLKCITKFDAITFQPNSGAQGEYTGLLTINKYFEHNGQSHRKVCLIPLSAHGTNPASAALAGMKVIPVAVDPEGNININDLKVKAEQYKDNLSTFMVTYPSTHGIYEDTIRESIKIVHSFGGQVYMDGANMNAQVGLTSPGFLDADVCHLNLHKTFCIPHGGGGPGMGPIGVKKHLSPFLPGHSLIKCGGEHSFGSVSSAPWSSASLLTISYAYIAQMGMKGLRKATLVAILNANYIQNKLKDKYKILYTGKFDKVAHEFIIDIRPIKEKTGISEEDIAKRLMDYGFHAPTMSFPVAGTLMVEPTESEDKAELDRFIEAFLNIREEIDKVSSGIYDKIDNPLKNAPHTYKHVISSQWNHKYSREEAAFPLPWIAERGKHWPSCGRIDNAYGDRNLICICPDITEYL